MIVTIEMNNMGHLEIDLESARQRRRYERLVEDLEPALIYPDESLIYLQREDDIDAFLEDARLTTAELKHLDNGWTVRKRMHVDTFDHYFGYSNQVDMEY